MKKIIFLLLALVFCSAAFTQLVNTKWKTTLQIDGPVNAIINFKTDTITVYTVAENTLIETMTYTKNAHSFILSKLDGQSDCDKGSQAEYGYIIKKDTLFLKLIKDGCYDRYSVLQDTKWTKWIDYTGIHVDEAILKQYTGVYALDAAHPITITLEQGTLYIEGPKNQLPKSPLTAITASKFFLRIAGVQMDFIKDNSGKVVKMISHEKADYELKKIK